MQLSFVSLFSSLRSSFNVNYSETIIQLHTDRLENEDPIQIWLHFHPASVNF
jgi:hypothetical protein